MSKNPLENHQDHHYWTYENRKLAAYRLLHVAGTYKNKLRCQVIETSEEEWKEKYESDNEGYSIFVSNGKYEIGDCEEATNFPLTKIRNTKPVGSAKSDKDVLAFLATLGDDNFQGDK